MRVGAGVGGVDVLGYHAYTATATWLVVEPGRRADAERARRPTGRSTTSTTGGGRRSSRARRSETSFFAGPATDAGTPTRRDAPRAAARRPACSSRFATSARLHAALLSVVRAVDDYTLADGSRSRAIARRCAPRGRRSPAAPTATRSAASMASPRARPRSSSAASSARSPTRRRSPAMRAPICPALAPHHVVAVRVGGGASTGDPTVGRTFLLGGDAPGARRSPISTATPSACSAASAATPSPAATSRVANAEYRFPIARPQRGIGTWPFFLHSIHARGVRRRRPCVDARRSAPSAIKTSVGAQLSADVVAGLLRAVHGHGRRRVGTRRQRTRPRSRHGVFPRRQGVLGIRRSGGPGIRRADQDVHR